MLLKTMVPKSLNYLLKQGGACCSECLDVHRSTKFALLSMRPLSYHYQLLYVATTIIPNTRAARLEEF